MRIVIQCAGSKRPEAPSFRQDDGRQVIFVADPASAPSQDGTVYAHPDECSDRAGQTWRARVIAENTPPNAEGSPLLTAGQLYTPKAYRTLREFVGAERLFILSAGWGLIRSDFRLPAYDITFSRAGDGYKRRRPSQPFADFNQLLGAGDDDVVFLGGRDYLPLFLQLSAVVQGRRLVFTKGAIREPLSSCWVQEFRTARSTNWHYSCADALASGEIAPRFDEKR